MALCPTGCAPSSITGMTGAGCKIVTRPGGFDRVIWKLCDFSFTNIETLSEWEDAIAAGQVTASGRVLGQKPKGSPSKRRVASCLPERTVNYTRNWSWKDSNADLTTLTEYDLYEFVDDNQDLLHIAFYTCDGLLYGFFEEYSLDVDDTRPETNDEDATMDCVCEVKSRLIAKPAKIPGLAEILNATT